MSNTTLVWFRHDLRLEDNPALLAAVHEGGGVVPVFIWSPEEEGRWQTGAASRWWLHQSLAQLDASLRQRGSRLIVRRGPALETLRQLIEETGGTRVCWNRRYEPAAIERDRRLKAALHQKGLRAESFNGSLLFEPWTVCTQQGHPYQVFTPFWKACRAGPEPEAPQPAQAGLKNPRRWPAGLPLRDLDLEPSIDWAGGLRTSWTPGEAGALRELTRFLDQGLPAYSEARDRPDRVSTSRLSPHLHFGEIGPRRVWSAVRAVPARSPGSGGLVPAGTWLAGICLPSALPLPAHSRATAPRAVRATFPGCQTGRTFVPGSAAEPAIRSWMPACANCGTLAGCTTASG